MIWPFSLFFKKRKPITKLSEPQYLMSSKPLTHGEARAALRQRAQQGARQTACGICGLSGARYHFDMDECPGVLGCAKKRIQQEEISQTSQGRSLYAVDPDPLILVDVPAPSPAPVPDVPVFQGFSGGDSGGGGASDDWGATASAPAVDPTPPSCDTSYSTPDSSPSFDSGTCDTSSSFDSGGSSSFDS
jgi:hypothetical protein